MKDWQIKHMHIHIRGVVTISGFFIVGPNLDLRCLAAAVHCVVLLLCLNKRHNFESTYLV